jgi:hypothetical protein
MTIMGNAEASIAPNKNFSILVFLLILGAIAGLTRCLRARRCRGNNGVKETMGSPI